eukprot:jgi/Ulvmu1/2109/UM126_0001.1
MSVQSLFTVEFLAFLVCCSIGLSPVSLTGVAAQPACVAPIPQPALNSTRFSFSYTDAWLGVAGFACSAGPPPTVNLDLQVQSIAIAGIVANQVAAVLSICRAAGSAQVRATGQALAVRRAEALIVSMSEALAMQSTCDDCAAIRVLERLSAQMLVGAVFGSWAEIYILADSGSEQDNLDEVTSVGITETIAAALPQIAASVRCLECTGVGITLSADDILRRCTQADVSTNMIAEAGAELASDLCQGNATQQNSQLELIAQDTASALAEAVVQADMFCKISDPESLNLMPCELLETDITSLVNGQVDVFLSAAAEARSCGCDFFRSIGGGVKAALIGVWESAVKNAYAETCIGARGGILSPLDVRNATEPRLLGQTSEIFFQIARFCNDGASVCGST